MNSDIEVKTLAPEFYQAVYELENAVFSSPRSLSMIKEDAENPRAVFLAGFCDGAFAGYGAFGYVLDEGYIGNIAVCPAFRRRGVASAILDEFDRKAKVLGLRFLSLEVRARNSAAISLYEKHGYVKMGLRKGFYVKPDDDGLIYTKEYPGQ
ncbi:MAG TPA: ribosomal protein S18-alanine N-acetyltransferase [Oscillospiraceae bacterium]|nr:ribosomal protein S18-alanine N-acetyltransferase [Oscillospiraceae bacterium]HPF55403.1 ribosomal protein S18-alanine N-acetyltransferase [Clostridiales bacterium]HPK35615.1 ribosomal protein S18-alanine N-acetyltransferase [Oscillospiraceae bacterium]HPR74679.1 ribosomal protein S18-alanine N-acetyltransferase [Oscillospiraceae bacterium]